MYTDSFEKALNKLKVAEDYSDLTSDDEKAKKRRKFCAQKQYHRVRFGIAASPQDSAGNVGHFS